MAKQTPRVEEALARLEEIVRALDAEGLPLEDSLKLFEEGVRLADSLKKRLEESELRIKKILERADGFKATSLDN